MDTRTRVVDLPPQQLVQVGDRLRRPRWAVRVWRLPDGYRCPCCGLEFAANEEQLARAHVDLEHACPVDAWTWGTHGELEREALEAARARAERWP